MLKRQRSTPSFTADAPYTSPEPAIDVFERVVKRRRQFAPPRDRGFAQGNSTFNTDDTDGEEDVEDDEQGSSQPQYHSEHAQRLEQAGEYRNVNTLLHDLHAEQRHRLLFSTPLPPSHLPMLHQHPHFPSSTDKTLPVLSGDGALPQAHHSSQKLVSSFTISIPSKDAPAVDHVEVQRVTQRYESANKLLGTLFLSRRRQPDTPGHPSQA